jgi:hypothetical protein
MRSTVQEFPCDVTVDRGFCHVCYNGVDDMRGFRHSERIEARLHGSRCNCFVVMFYMKEIASFPGNDGLMMVDHCTRYSVTSRWLGRLEEQSLIQTWRARRWRFLSAKRQAGTGLPNKADSASDSGSERRVS